MAKAKSQDPIPLLEWLSAGIGLLIAVALLAIIGREALMDGGESELPVLYVHVAGIEAAAGGHVVKIVVRNDSGQTAARVDVEGKSGSEVSRASLDYVPGRSQAKGGLLFRGDPRRDGLTVRVTGYQLP